jgi:hypothetical protein
LAAYQQRFKFLSQFAVEYRYPGMHASARQARSALRWAEAIRAETHAGCLVYVRANPEKSESLPRIKAGCNGSVESGRPAVLFHSCSSASDCSFSACWKAWCSR